MIGNLQKTQGATLAPDGIPLHFGDELAEYEAALKRSILLDRSHEARLALSGADVIDVLHRISTNDLENLGDGQARPTVFTNANARIIDRAVIANSVDRTLVLGGPGRNAALSGYLQRNIFFNDDARIEDVTGTSHQFGLHGPQAASVMARYGVEVEVLHGQTTEIDGVPVFALRRKPMVEDYWSIIVFDRSAATKVWQALSEHARPAGSLTFNVLRIRSGQPGVGRELTTDYIPLEVGLWDEVSFAKGCYTGQEIIARMESRNRLAKTIVRLQLSEPVRAPAPLLLDGKQVGTLTSSVRSPTGESYGIGVVKGVAAQQGVQLTVAEHVQGSVIDLAGTQPSTDMLT